MHSCSPSAYPWISASGVFNSWETLDKNSLRISSISVFLSLSSFSSLLALFNSDIVRSSVSESWFICSPSWSSSFFPFPWYFASKSSPIMRLDISVSSNTGIVTRFVTKTTVTALKMTAIIPTYVRKRFDIVTLSLILSSGVRIMIRFPSGRIPQRT